MAALKKVRQFMPFRWDDFSREKDFVCTGCVVWKDFETKAVLGTKVKAVIVRDDTKYEQKEGEHVSNLFAHIDFKVPRDVSIPSNTYIRPVNAKVTAYGQYMNELSIKCDDIQVIHQNAQQTKG